MTIEIADRLIKLRKKNGYSQEEVAKYLGVTYNTISNYERDVRMPDLDAAQKLAHLYGVSVSAIFDGGLSGEDYSFLSPEAKNRLTESQKKAISILVDEFIKANEE